MIEGSSTPSPTLTESNARAERIDVGSGARAAYRALQSAAERLRDDGYPRAAEMTEKTAARFDHAVHSMAGRDPRSIVQEAQRFARDNPTAFIAGCAVAGFVLARFLGTTAEIGEDHEPRA